MSDPKDKVVDAAQEADSIIKEGAAAVGDIASQAKEKVIGVAREAGNQAASAAQAAYSQGNELLDTIEEAVRHNPWTTLLLVGAIGYGLGLYTSRR
jgi:ElaB/YqjD/DUF883 family membrane-anchored ribosome-binding protein